MEISNLRETYVEDINSMRNSVNQYKELLRQSQEENNLLKDILRARGIPFQAELESRRAQAVTMNAQNSGFGSSVSGPSRNGSYQTVTPSNGTTIGALTPSPRGNQPSFNSGMGNVVSPSTGPTSYHSLSPSDMGFSERSIKREDSGVSEMPGVFEQNPQLGVDFILA